MGTLGLDLDLLLAMSMGVGSIDLTTFHYGWIVSHLLNLISLSYISMKVLSLRLEAFCGNVVVREEEREKRSREENIYAKSFG